MQSRILGPIVAAVLVLHGAVVFFSLRTSELPPPEVTAVVAFFVSPADPPSPPVRAAPAERRPTPKSEPVPQAEAPQPQPLLSQPTRPIETPAPSVAASTAQAASQPGPALVPSEPSEPASRASPTVSQPAAVPAPASEPAPAAPIAVSIDAVRYLKPPQVVYPPLSRRMGETGRVVVRVLVDVQGVPAEVTLAEPSRYARLNDQALQAMRQARFEPYRVNGRSISVTVLAPIVFTLEDRP